MAYLNLDLNFLEHPKTLRLNSAIGKDSEIYPIRLWIYCGKYHPDNGKLDGYTNTEIEAIVKWSGEKGTLVAALIKFKFLLKTEKGYKVKDWEDHEGHFFALRERAKAGAMARWNKIKGISKNVNSTMDSAGVSNKNVRKVVGHILKTFESKKGARYPFSNIDGKIIKSLVTLYSESQVMALWDVFLGLDNDWLKKVGHKITEFQRQIPMLLDKTDWKTKVKEYEDKKVVNVPLKNMPPKINEQSVKVESLKKIKLINELTPF